MALVRRAEPEVAAPPLERDTGPGRAIVLGAAGALIAAVAAVIVAGVGFANPSTGPIDTVIVPWAPPPAQVAVARLHSCQMWGRTAAVIDGASNAVSRAPADWKNPATQEALANEARVILVESAYMRRELPGATPIVIRAAIDNYVAANFDQENATVHRQGTARDAAIDRVNAAEDQVNAACR